MTVFALVFAMLSVQPSCRPVSSNRILVKDLAAAVPAFRALPVDLPFGFAPVPGAKRNLDPIDLERFARLHGMEVRVSSPVCFEWALSVPSKADIAAAMRATLARDNLKIEIVQISTNPAPHGEVVFPMDRLQRPAPTGGSAPVLWRGYVLYGGTQRFAIWARVRLSIPATRVMTVKAIRAGEIIQSEQVRLESCEAFPLESAIAQNLEEVVGMMTEQSLPAEVPVIRSLLQAPREVTTGDVVQVWVSSGSARLALFARAESSGRSGEYIMVRNLNNGRLFRARIEGKGRVRVYVPAAASAAAGGPR